jgi:hypothetical protein
LAKWQTSDFELTDKSAARNLFTLNTVGRRDAQLWIAIAKELLKKVEAALKV